MKRGEPVANEPDKQKYEVVSTTDMRVGFDAQGEALEILIDALDRHLEVMDAADADKAKVEQAAHSSDRRIKGEAEAKKSSQLGEISARHAQAKAEIDDKRSAKLEAAKQERQKAEDSARSLHRERVAKAKKRRTESVWLADTVLESSLQNEQKFQANVLGEINGLKESIDTLESVFAEELGPSMANRLLKLPLSQCSKSGKNTHSIEGLRETITAATDAVAVYSGGGLFRLFRGRAKKMALATEACELIHAARSYSDELLIRITLEHEGRLEKIRQQHHAEIEKAEITLRGHTKESERETGAIVKQATESHDRRLSDIEDRFALETTELEAWQASQTAAVLERYETSIADAQRALNEQTESAQTAHSEASARAMAILSEPSTEALGLLRATQSKADCSNPTWESMRSDEQPTQVPGVVRFGDLRLDLQSRSGRLKEHVRDSCGIPAAIDMPALLTLPGPKSLLIRHDDAGRDQALSTLRCVMTRVLASFPAGKARFVMADPIGIGQSFAGYMRLSDQEPSPVGQRIWAEPQQIERQLADLTEHMQTVIQKYLRSDFQTIEDYNAAAGEIAEPYRFVIIADLHEALTDAGAARLKSILDSGPRCGVYALMCMKAAESLPADLRSTLDGSVVELCIAADQPRLSDERFAEAQLVLDSEPDDRITADILDRVARAGTQAGRVEVAFDRLIPDEGEIWSRTCADELVVPLGRSGAQKNQELRLGLGTRQHTLIAGRTGSGKSTLLHVMITAAAMWYSPDELEMYLIDFKKGVEFKAYTGGRLPHVRAVAIESDREFGLSVLKRLDEELTERGELFRKLGAQNLASARSMAPDERLPRVLLLIDEFQEFFTEDDEVSSEATLLLDRLVRQGRAFGVHVVLGSQTLAGAYSLARSTLGQIGVRIALQCSETDSYLILGEDNNAARLLERPGEAIYNNAGGLVEGNSPFQTAWLSDAQRDEALDALPDVSDSRPEPVVFEGNKPAQLEKSVMAFAKTVPNRHIPRLLLGDAVAIAPPTSVALTKRSGANLLVVSPQPDAAMGMLFSSVVTFSSSPDARVIFVDATPEDDPSHGQVAARLQALGSSVEVVGAAEAARVVRELNQGVGERVGQPGAPTLLVLGGLHRLRSLRRSDDYSFSLDEETSSPDKDLTNILLEGPAHGVWTIAWCDTLNNLERAMDRGAIREFGLRVMMQMSASDSTMLMDSSAASSLGANRAIMADEVSGLIQKFRPFDVPSEDAVRISIERLQSGA
jgi:hypothetical protein